MEKNRIVVVEYLTFQEANNPHPVVAHTSLSRHLASEDLTYINKVSVDSEWVLIEAAHLAGRVGMLHLKNEPKFFGRKPPPEVQREADNLVVEVRLGDGQETMEIRPSDSLRITTSCQRVYARCPTGKTRLTVTALPR